MVESSQYEKFLVEIIYWDLKLKKQMAHGDSELEFKQITTARRWCKGEKLRGYPKRDTVFHEIPSGYVLQFKITRKIEIWDSGIEIINAKDV